mmetsp:Transcript_16099/g.38456  ORF Transcript_16099/g.38456 Transcript_16099/m.38456 type:complete len:210 (-) Transcript_16099:337-966(-)
MLEGPSIAAYALLIIASLVPSLSMARRSALVVIDMSVEQVGDLSYRKQQVIDTIGRLIDSNAFDLCVDSRLWITDPSKSSLPTLYPTVGRASTKGAELIPELRDKNMVFVHKWNYSGFTSPSRLSDVLKEHRIQEVFMTGINTNYCVFATALDAFYQQYTVRVIEDAVSSIEGAQGHKDGLRWISKFMGGDVVVTSHDAINRTNDAPVA